MARTESDVDLKTIAERIRRQPGLAQDMDVSALVEEVAGRWREHSDMIEASEEVPVAAWIVRRKVEGLVRPEVEDEEPEPFDVNKRPAWLVDAVESLQHESSTGQRYWTRSIPVVIRRRPAAVKDASPWTLCWSYPRLRPRKSRPVATVAHQPLPLKVHIEEWRRRLVGGQMVAFQEAMAGESRETWVVSFLAAAHLWHERAIEVRQNGAYAPLLLQGHRTESRPHDES